MFSGHGGEGLIISQDNMELNLETEVFPNLFGKDRFVKLIFIDACRQFIGRGELTKGSLKSYVQKAMGNPTVKYRPDPSHAREYAFISYATLPGHSAEDKNDGSEFSKSFTKWLRRKSLYVAMDKVTQDVEASNALEYSRPMRVNMLSEDINLYEAAKKVCGPSILYYIKNDNNCH